MLQDELLRPLRSPSDGADFNGLIGKTEFPCYLLIPQNISEGILDQKLRDTGILVHRPYKVVGMRQDPKDRNIVDVSFENGQSISAQYVIGADGSQSIVSAITASLVGN